MTILINCSSCKVGGGVQVCLSFLAEISCDKKYKYIVVMSDAVNEQLDQRIFNSNFIFYRYNIPANVFSIFFPSNKVLDNLVEKYCVDKVFTVFGPSYWRPKVKHICGYAKPHYIYKESPFFQTLGFKEKNILKIKEFLHLKDFSNNTDVLITENADVSSKLGIILGRSVETVSNYYHQIFEETESWSNRELPQFEGSYLLTISANYPHKNLNIIPHVVKELINRGIDKFKFVVTLDKGDLGNDLSIDDFIVYLGRVDINQCPSLYNQVDYMFLPTLLECFSASYVEAMFMKKIILTSDLDFARGICGNAAIYFNPLDACSIVDNLLLIDGNVKEKSRLINNGLSKLKCFDTSSERANKYLKIITNS